MRPRVIDELPTGELIHLLNGDEAFFGLYPLVEHKFPFPDGSHAMYDLIGKDASARSSGS